MADRRTDVLFGQDSCLEEQRTDCVPGAEKGLASGDRCEARLPFIGEHFDVTVARLCDALLSG